MPCMTASPRLGTLGIVRECYSIWERRAPLTPTHVAKLAKVPFPCARVRGGVRKLIVRGLAQDGIRVLVQPCDRRVFSNAEYEDAGALLVEDLGEAAAILGVKQVPAANLLPGRAYAFFSHTIKAQPENMALLDAVRSNHIRLFDYECITEGGVPGAPRAVAFGRFAGYAGMINGLRGANHPPAPRRAAPYRASQRNFLTVRYEDRHRPRRARAASRLLVAVPRGRLGVHVPGPGRSERRRTRSGRPCEDAGCAPRAGPLHGRLHRLRRGEQRRSGHLSPPPPHHVCTCAAFRLLCPPPDTLHRPPHACTSQGLARGACVGAAPRGPLPAVRLRARGATHRRPQGPPARRPALKLEMTCS